MLGQLAQRIDKDRVQRVDAPFDLAFVCCWHSTFGLLIQRRVSEAAAGMGEGQSKYTIILMTVKYKVEKIDHPEISGFAAPGRNGSITVGRFSAIALWR